MGVLCEVRPENGADTSAEEQAGGSPLTPSGRCHYPPTSKIVNSYRACRGFPLTSHNLDAINISMQGVQKERWFQLCQLAAVERDPAKMLALITQINDLLEEKEKRLEAERKADPYTRK